ncbi:MAG TPA: hypothetical protein VNJ08_10200 [Bacteriovoracaceae bacterium]|nr:hypothetical protein [Bacteriovoracaceae bacterium]
MKPFQALTLLSLLCLPLQALADGELCTASVGAAAKNYYSQGPEKFRKEALALEEKTLSRFMSETRFITEDIDLWEKFIDKVSKLSPQDAENEVKQSIGSRVRPFDKLANFEQRLGKAAANNGKGVEITWDKSNKRLEIALCDVKESIVKEYKAKNVILHRGVRVCPHLTMYMTRSSKSTPMFMSPTETRSIYNVRPQPIYLAKSVQNGKTILNYHEHIRKYDELDFIFMDEDGFARVQVATVCKREMDESQIQINGDDRGDQKDSSSTTTKGSVASVSKQ